VRDINIGSEREIYTHTHTHIYRERESDRQTD
jgi:hypothetical protein